MEDKHVEIDGRKLTLTNLDKVFWPESGLTKGDLIAYYDEISKYLLPHLAGRPESMNRYPDGIHGLTHFFQKNLEDRPDWIPAYIDFSHEDNHQVNYAIVNERAALLYLINLGCIDLNVWSSRAEHPDEPDFVLFDLDPIEVEWKQVTEVALAIRDTLEAIGVESYPKTTGKRGLHIYIPLAPRHTYEQSLNFGHLIALLVHEKLPDITSLERLPKHRQGKVYLDYLQNHEGATMAAPYSVRPVPDATVSTPLTWEEVEKGAKPSDFTIKNTLARLEKHGDIFAPVLKNGINLEKVLKKIK